MIKGRAAPCTCPYNISLTLHILEKSSAKWRVLMIIKCLIILLVKAPEIGTQMAMRAARNHTPHEPFIMKRIKDLNIFIVDDNQLARKAYQQYLTRLGCEKLRMFDNGQDCINNLVETPDLVLIDYCMEPLNGLDVLKKIRRFNPDVYLVMISGQTDLQVAINAMKYGAFDYIIKGDTENEQVATVLHKMLHVMNIVKRGRPKSIPQKIMSILSV